MEGVCGGCQCTAALGGSWSHLRDNDDNDAPLFSTSMRCSLCRVGFRVDLRTLFVAEGLLMSARVMRSNPWMHESRDVMVAGT